MRRKWLRGGWRSAESDGTWQHGRVPPLFYIAKCPHCQSVRSDTEIILSPLSSALSPFLSGLQTLPWSLDNKQAGDLGPWLNLTRKEANYPALLSTLPHIQSRSQTNWRGARVSLNAAFCEPSRHETYLANAEWNGKKSLNVFHIAFIAITNSM